MRRASQFLAFLIAPTFLSGAAWADPLASTGGVIPISQQGDEVGPHARTVADAASTNPSGARLVACVASPFKGALDAAASVKASVKVSVDVKASASASGSGSAGGKAG